MNTFEFRGISFAATGSRIKLHDLAELYFVFRALEGEKLAQDILITAGTVVKDVSGNQIWPCVLSEDGKVIWGSNGLPLQEVPIVL